jgi:hypothetical protein
MNDPRMQAAMDAINSPVANIGLSGIDHNMALLGEIRQAMEEGVTTPMDALPGKARAKHVALAMIASITTDVRILEIATAGLYGRDPREAS